MVTIELEAELRRNPRAASQEAVIREAFASLEDLRSAGIVAEGYTLAEPYRGQLRSRTGDVTQPSPKRSRRTSKD